MNQSEEIKNRAKRKSVTSEITSTETEENKMPQENPKKNTERKRVSFEIRKDLHNELKMLSVMEDKKMYELIEESIENLLRSRS